MTQGQSKGRDASQDWTYEVREVSAGVYRGIARDRHGREVSREGTDPDGVLLDLHEWARGIDMKAVPTLARVRMRLIDVEAGGRSMPLGPSWRGLARIEGSKEDHGIELLLDPPGSLAPGQTGVGSLMWLFETTLDLAVGCRIELREGPHLVGVGEIIPND
jgi:hypothetical protein